MSLIKSITIFGSSKPGKDDPLFKQVFAVAKKVAEEGFTVVNGGGPGVMLAATLGAKEGGGKTKVVYYEPESATAFDGKCLPNFADEHFKESNYILRVKKLMELGDLYICFNGGTGTISEFAMAWGLARLYFGHHKPLILYGAFWKEIVDVFRKNMIARDEEYRVFTIVKSPDEVLDAIAKYEVLLKLNRHTHDPHHCKNGECYLMI